VSPPASTLATQEKDVIEAALRESRAGCPDRSARHTARVPASTLESKIKQLKIDKRRFQSG